MGIEEVLSPVKDKLDDSFSDPDSASAFDSSNSSLQVQILVQILTQALIQTKSDDHEMVMLVLIELHVVWDQLQPGGSPFFNPPLPGPSRPPPPPAPPPPG